MLFTINPVCYCLKDVTSSAVSNAVQYMGCVGAFEGVLILNHSNSHLSLWSILMSAVVIPARSHVQILRVDGRTKN